MPGISNHLVPVELPEKGSDSRRAIVEALEGALRKKGYQLSFPPRLEYDPAREELVIKVFQKAGVITSGRASLRVPAQAFVAELRGTRTNLQCVFDLVPGEGPTAERPVKGARLLEEEVK